MLVAFNIILDDIVFPDGHSAMSVLGGGGPQAAFGMRLFAQEVGLVARVGSDLPESARAWLIESGIDTSGLHLSDSPTPRAWQVTESDGRRTQVWRVRPGGRAPLPESYRQAQGYHLGIHPESPDLSQIAEMRRMGLVSLETCRLASRYHPRPYSRCSPPPIFFRPTWLRPNR